MHSSISDQASQVASNVVAFGVASSNAAALRQAALASSYRVATALAHADALDSAVTLAGTIGRVSG